MKKIIVLEDIVLMVVVAMLIFIFSAVFWIEEIPEEVVENIGVALLIVMLFLSAVSAYIAYKRHEIREDRIADDIKRIYNKSK